MSHGLARRARPGTAASLDSIASSHGDLRIEFRRDTTWPFHRDDRIRTKHPRRAHGKRRASAARAPTPHLSARRMRDATRARGRCVPACPPPTSCARSSSATRGSGWPRRPRLAALSTTTSTSSRSTSQTTAASATSLRASCCARRASRRRTRTGSRRAVVDPRGARAWLATMTTAWGRGGRRAKANTAASEGRMKRNHSIGIDAAPHRERTQAAAPERRLPLVVVVCVLRRSKGV